MNIVRVERDGVLLEVPIDPNHFSIDVSALDQELAQAGRLIYEYGMIEAETRLRVSRLEVQLETARAKADTLIRAEFNRSGEKATEAKIENRVTQAAECQTISEQLSLASHDATVMKHVMSALVHKSENLRGLAYREGQSIKADRG